MKEAIFSSARMLALYDRISDAEDAIPRLRRLVLDLAVHGKLVEQDVHDKSEDFTPSDRSGKTLGSRATNKKVPPSVEPYSLPKMWKWVEIGDQLDLLNGMAFKPSDWATNGLRIVRIQNLNRQDAPFNYCDPNFARERSLIDVGSFLISWSGTPGTSFGAFIWDRGPAVLNQHIFRCDFKTEAFNPNYLQLAINGRLDEMIEKAHGGVGLQHITKGKLEAMLIGLPPLAEQHRIVAKVDELMALCDQLEQARAGRETVRDRLTAASLARLTTPDNDAETFQNDARFALQSLPTLTTRPNQIKTLRQTILSLAVRGRLVEQDASDEPAFEYLRALPDLPAKTLKLLRPLDPSDCGGDLPMAWAWLPLGAIIYGMDAGWSPQCESHPRSSEKEWGVLKTTAVQTLSFDAIQHKLLPTKLKPRPQFQAEVGDILVTRAGPKNRVGISCVVDVPCPKLMISDKLIRFHALGELSARYIALTLNAGYTFEQIEAAKSGMAVMQMNISQNKLKAIPIPLPPLAEQHRIVTKVDALMTLCDQLEASLTTTATTRSKLLNALLHEALEPASDALAAAE
jgi:type I restriction enzyme S subunit